MANVKAARNRPRGKRTRILLALDPDVGRWWRDNFLVSTINIVVATVVVVVVDVVIIDRIDANSRLRAQLLVMFDKHVIVIAERFVLAFQIPYFAK